MSIVSPEHAGRLEKNNILLSRIQTHKSLEFISKDCLSLLKVSQGLSWYSIATMGVRPHTCPAAGIASGITDAKEPMKTRVDFLAIEQIATPARQI
ncbi:LOW QUALITY PROTEIN: Hypothetical protein PHPALM_3256 [Phytophthora palmivora]|uniref:Uncharacterized protein n=1 Tax=Phytophthora palmivora TaxID=4796 RepID=A0A2P4YMY3_9STRA|nr:LOW QUALITY PROTEIN: Hypothetical protein PHPALM_3256 [Phytophthora palmivora]